MKIKNKMLISTSVSIALMIVFGFIAYTTFQEINSSRERRTLSENIIKDVFDLATLRTEYVLNPSERPKIQWFLKYESLGNSIKKAEEEEEEEEWKAVLRDIRQNYNDIKPLFSEFVNYTENPGNRLQEFGTRIRAQILIKSQEIADTSQKLNFISNSRVQSATERMTLIIIAIIIISILLIIINLITFYSIVKPIVQLHKATESLAEGNFSTRIYIRSKDELGQLGNAFNKMAADLRKTAIIAEKRTKEKGEESEATLNILEDVTETQKKLKQSYEQLKGLDTAKTDFLNIVSHELKTPLTAIYANLELLEEAKAKLSEKNINNLNALRRNSNQLKFLVDNVLEIARIQSNKFELNISEVNLGDCISSIENDLKVLADKKNIKLIMEIDKSIIISTDEIRLKEILTNLIDNSIKFTEKGYVKVKATKKGDNFLVEVMDTGIGISKDKKSKLFEKFYQIHNPLETEVGGTGLGLSITKQLVEILGGKIDFKSESGKGSVFYFTLPIRYKK